MRDPATNLLVQAAAAFLQRYPPFAQMRPQRVASVATRLKLAYYPMHATLLDPSHGPVSTFFIIQRGRIESRRSQSDELFESSIHALGVGECFPMSALLGRRATRNTYRALRDLFAIQRHGLHHVSRAIATATNLASRQQAAADVRQLTLRMLAQGVAAPGQPRRSLRAAGTDLRLVHRGL